MIVIYVFGYISLLSVIWFLQVAVSSICVFVLLCISFLIELLTVVLLSLHEIV